MGVGAMGTLGDPTSFLVASMPASLSTTFLLRPKASRRLSSSRCSSRATRACSSSSSLLFLLFSLSSAFTCPRKRRRAWGGGSRQTDGHPDTHPHPALSQPGRGSPRRPLLTCRRSSCSSRRASRRSCSSCRRAPRSLSVSLAAAACPPASSASRCSFSSLARFRLPKKGERGWRRRGLVPVLPVPPPRHRLGHKCLC